MSIYILKVSSSGEYVNKIQWDGISSITISPSHSLELYDYTSSAYIPFSSESMYDTSVIQEQANVNIFSGRLEDPVLLNGKPIKRLFTDTNDGVLQLISGSQGDLILNTSGSFILDDFDNTNNIFMSLYNYDLESQLYYSSSISRIIDNNITDYILNLNHELVKYSYLVKNTEITSSTSGSYLKLDVEEIYKKSNKVNETSNNLTHQQLINFAWDVDFDLGDNAQVGDFYGNFYGSVNGAETGSFTGSFTGSAELTGSFLGQFEGLLDGTASYAGYALTSSFTENASTVDVFLKSKNWTKPSWAKTIRVTCVGGGGGGGAAPATETSGIVAGGGGGGGGTITIGEFDADTLPSTISVTIGAGGNGGIYDGMILKFPSNGGDTYFGDYLIARGGNHGFNGGVESLRALGGSTVANIEYKNTGAGGGGAGTVDGNILNMPLIFDASMAPPLPLPIEYIRTGLGGPEYNYYLVIPTPIPAVIAPTGGGGGLGYDPDNGGRQDGVTTGGSISEYSLTNNNNKYKSLTPILYNSSSYDYYPGFNSKVGLGGKGGNPYLLVGPTDGTMYGGGGGGAYGGGVDGIYANGQLNGTEYNFGANGAIGAVIIISEA